MPAVSNKGVAINFDVVGKGPVLVMHHGGYGSLYDWCEYGYVEALVDAFRIVLVDARGHGKSDKPLDPSLYSLEQHADDVITVLDNIDVDTFNYLGFSMGAMIGFVVATQAPKRLRRCACLAGHPFFLAMEGVRDATRNLHEWAAEPSFSNWHRSRLFDNDLDALMAAYANDRPDHSEALQRSNVSFLLVVGRQDDVDSAEAAAKILPNSELVVLENFSHVDILFKSDQVIPHVRKFLESNH